MSYMDALENDVLDALLGSGGVLLGNPVEIALSTTVPNDDGTGITEPVGFDYARVAVPNGAAGDPADSYWPVAASGQKLNGQEIAFPAANGGSWGLIQAWVLYDGGVPKLFGILDDGLEAPTPRPVNDGDIFKFQIGQLRIIQS